MKVKTLLLILPLLGAAGCAPTFGVDIGGASSAYLMAGGLPEAQVGLRLSPSRLRGYGLDFALALASSPIEVDVADAAASYRVPLGPDAALGLRGGLTAITNKYLGGVGAGYNGGVGFIARLSPNLAVRADYTTRQLFQRLYAVGEPSRVHLSSITLGVALGH